MKIAVLAGGVGAGRFLSGLMRVVDPADVSVIVNTGDDERLKGLPVCPDADTVLYHLAGLADWERGWGIRGDTFSSNERYAALAAGVSADAQDWFNLGDLDLATKMLRARLLDAGLSLTEATDAVRRGMGVECAVLPMSETPVRTVFSTAAGERLEFHDYFVKRRQQVEVAEVIFEGAAQPPRAALVALREADVILLTPSNPILSIAPVLHALGDVVHASGAAKAGVSPIVGGRTIKGPAAALLESLGHEPTAAGAAATYAGLLDVWVMDDQDAALSPRIRDLGMRPVVTDTIMRSQQDAARLAKTVLESL